MTISQVSQENHHQKHKTARTLAHLIYCHNNDTDMIESTEDFKHIPMVARPCEAPIRLGADQNLGLFAAHATAVFTNSARLITNQLL